MLCMFYIRSKNVILHQIYLGALKLSKQKKFWKFSNFFFWTVYRVRGVMVGGNFSPIWEYSSTVKNRQKWASVHRRVGLKGLKLSSDSLIKHLQKSVLTIRLLATLQKTKSLHV